MIVYVCVLVSCFPYIVNLVVINVLTLILLACVMICILVIFQSSDVFMMC